MTTFSDRDVLSDGKYAGLIQRFHCFPVSKQLIGQHCWGMYLIYRKIWGPPPSATTEYIMFHDNGELGTGDAPLYAKRDVPELKPLLDKAEKIAAERQGLNVPEPDAKELWRVKACDLLEGMQHCLMDIQSGNQLAIPATQNYLVGLLKHLEKETMVGDDADKVMEFRNAMLNCHKKIMNAHIY